MMDTINITGSHLKALQHQLLHVLQHPQNPGRETRLFCTDEAIINYFVTELDQTCPFRKKTGNDFTKDLTINF